MVLFGLLYRPFFRRFENQSAALYFALYNLGYIVFLIGIPLASASDRWPRGRRLAARARR